jgi:hypothetical protein
MQVFEQIFQQKYFPGIKFLMSVNVRFFSLILKVLCFYFHTLKLTKYWRLGGAVDCFISNVGGSLGLGAIHN